MTVTVLPTVSKRALTATIVGRAAGVTRKVESTARWSEGQGVMLSDAPGSVFSPTISLASVLEGPAVYM